MNPRALTPREKRRRRLQQRQTVVFGLLIAALAVVAGFAWLVQTGVVDAPWKRPISMPEKIITSETMECPPPGAYSLDLMTIEAHVFNSSNQQGLGGSVAGGLREFGVSVPEVGNWPQFLINDGQLQTGRDGLVAAYTLQQLFPTLEVMILDREGPVVDVILGHTFGADSMRRSGDFPAGTEIVPPDACIPDEEETPAEEVGEGGGDEVPEDEPADEGDSDDGGGDDG